MSSLKHQFIPIIDELISDIEGVLNTTMAKEASWRLGRKVTMSDISRVRNEIGQSMYQRIVRQAIERLVRRLTSDVAEQRPMVAFIPASSSRITIAYPHSK